MTVPRKAFMQPLRFSDDDVAAMVVRVRIGAATFELIDLGAVLTPYENYWASGDGEIVRAGEKDIFEIFIDELISVDADFSYTLDAETNIPTYEHASESFTFQWAHASSTLDGTIFGFTDVDTAHAASNAAPNTSKGIWLPEQECLYDSFDDPQMVGVTVATQDGESRASNHDQTLYLRDIHYHLLDDEHIRKEAGASPRPYNTLEYAWVDGRWGKGAEVRVYDDATDRALDSFKVYRKRNKSKNPWRRPIKNRLIYNVELELLRVADYYEAP